MMSRRVARAMVYVGIAVVVLGLSKVHARYIADPPYSFTGSFRFAWALAYIVLLGVAAYGVGLPEVPRSTRQALQSAVAASIAGALAISLVQLIVGDALLPRFVVFGSAILLVPWFVICVALVNGDSGGSKSRDRVVVVSDVASMSALRHELAVGAERAAGIVKVLSTEEAQSRGDGARPLTDVSRKGHATVIVLDRDAQSAPSVVAQAATLHQTGVRVRTLSLFYEEWLGKLPVSELERVSLLFDIGEVHRARYVRVKRVIDLILASLGSIVLVVAIPFVMIGNRIANRGPLFYSQPRIGKGGVDFEILKFRTMRPADDGDLHNEWTQEDDPRITRFGRILRLTHLDELPQMLNILRGDLSMVGPRPEQPQYVAELSEKLPFYDVRHLVRPGLTGWAQVKYGYAGDESDALKKLQYEFFYLRHQSMALDLRIIGRTLRSVFGREGR
jgi:lipopolysaccharide/colanic/teichoic acid biosynthesis glycosyltransferase